MSEDQVAARYARPLAELAGRIAQVAFAEGSAS
jgi:hypothetical protein